MVPAPFGWVLDLVDRINSFATIHQRGLTLKEAQKRNEWMYMQFWTKDNSKFNIENLIELQNTNISQFKKNPTFSYNTLVQRADGCQTKIRIAEIPDYPAIEVTGFIEFESHILFIVLFSPKELLNKNLRKLQHILKVSTPITIQFDNTQVIKQCLETIDHTTDNQQKADKYFQIGNWYKEMDDVKMAFKYYEKGIESYPTHYTYLKKIIEEALRQNMDDKAKIYAIQLFEIEAKNPKVPQDLIEIYLSSNRQILLINLFLERIKQHKDYEVLGNLNFHIGLIYLNMGKQKKADEYIQRAKFLFKKVYPSNHNVFKTINEYVKRKNWA